MSEGFEPDLNAWDAWRPEDVAAALAGAPLRWAVAAGWALDLFLGAETRPHEDVEIAISEETFGAVRAALPELEWFVVGDGRAWPFGEAPAEHHQTWGRDADGRWRLDVFRERWDGDDWVFRRDRRIRRPLAEAITADERGIPYLVPEVVLLYKAKAARGKDEADFGRVLPSLADVQRRWLREMLSLVHPEHDWLVALDP